MTGIARDGVTVERSLRSSETTVRVMCGNSRLSLHGSGDKGVCAPTTGIVVLVAFLNLSHAADLGIRVYGLG